MQIIVQMRQVIQSEATQPSIGALVHSAANERHSAPDDQRSPRTDDSDDERTESAKVYAKKALPQVKTVVSRAFRWYRSQSVDNISEMNAAPKPVVAAKPKTTSANKGILQYRLKP